MHLHVRQRDQINDWLSTDDKLDNSYKPINTLRFYLCVCLSVRDGCGRGRNELAGRVQNHHVPAVTEMAIIFLELEIVKAAAGRDTQGFRLHEGCHCGRLPSH